MTAAPVPMPSAEESTTSPRTMKAIVQDAWGHEPESTLRLADIERPAIDEGAVEVRVAASSVDRGTVHCMTGQPYAMRLAGFGMRRPKASNPGRSFAGTVESVGSGVTGFAPGDEVYGTCDGSFAEFARVKPGRLAPKPANLSFEHAGAAPISGVTALQAVRKGNVQPGTRVLVTGASGGVGTFAVQIAKAFGAEVTGMCSTGKVDMVRSLGADHVIDYTSGAITGPDDRARRYDVIIDIAGNTKLSQLRRALTDRGTLVIVGGETGGRWLGGFGRSLRAVVLSPFVRPTLGMFASTENAADLDVLRGLIEAGHVTPVIDRVYPLSDTAAAIRHVQEGRARGKVVVTM
jgi:NADPH:quinone reductase-like Zn-dependent oxidoreductase